MLRTMTGLCLSGLLSLACFAQSDTNASAKKPATPETSQIPAKQFYHLNFVVQELANDRVVNSRSYSMTMDDGGQSSIRAGENIPFSAAASTTKEQWQSQSWQQIHVGVNIDCRRLDVTRNGVALQVKAEITSVMEGHEADTPRAPASAPVIRQNQWESYVTLPIKQPTILFSSDDPASKRTMQLKLTVTPVR